jgi:hypothetical protein
MLEKLTVMMGLPQLVTALIGGFIALGFIYASKGKRD